MLLVQLSNEKKNPASSSIPAVNLSVILKEIERTTLIYDYFLLHFRIFENRVSVF